MPLLRPVLLSTAAMLLLGVAAGLVWAWLAEPAEYEVLEQATVMTEGASQAQFAVIVMFVLIGAATSLVWGWVSGWTLRDLGWRLTPFVVLLTGAAAAIAWRVGTWAGPPDPRSVDDPAVGDRIPAELVVDGLAPFLVWPIFGLVGLIGAVWLSPRERVEPDR